MMLIQFFPMMSTVCNISSLLTAPCTIWASVALMAVFAMIAVLACIYLIAPLAGSNELRTWVKVKIYDLLASIFLIIIFAAFATMLYTVNPEPILYNLKLLPNSCVGMTDLYGIGVCDIHQFNMFTIELNNMLFYTLEAFSFQPEFTVNIGQASVSKASTTGSTTGAAASAGEGAAGAAASAGEGAAGAAASAGEGAAASAAGDAEGGSLLGAIGLSAGPLALIPQYTSFKYLSGALDVFFAVEMLNEVQLIVLSSSVVIFAIFMALGLIARSFGVTRTFGGAMIAFALGIGFVYPLMTSLTYGFIDYGMQNTLYTGWLTAGAAALTPYVMVGTLILDWSIGNIGPLNIGQWIIQNIPGVQQLFIFVGLSAMGLVFVPIINFVIVDTFIVDFSQAVGERMDFMSLLTNIPGVGGGH